MSSPSVFLSHSAPDKAFVRWLAEQLHACGAKIWLDEAEIKVGESLIDKISEGVDRCDYLAAIISQNSVRSEWVKRELNIALTQEIRGRKVKVLPLIIGKCDLPMFLLDKKYLDFDNPEHPNLDSLRSLLDDLGLSGRDRSFRFFRRFIAYDCYDQNDGFDVDVINHFRPAAMEKILSRLWFFGITVHGMDIAMDCGEGKGARGSRWAIVDAAWPMGDGAGELDRWIDFVRQPRFADCALSLSYTVPEEILDLFIEP